MQGKYSESGIDLIEAVEASTPEPFVRTFARPPE